MQHPTFTAALADQHRQALARQALARRASLARAGPEQPAHRPVAVACHGPLVAAGHPARPGLNRPPVGRHRHGSGRAVDPSTGPGRAW